MIVVEIWKNQPGKFFCISTKSAGGKWKDHFFTPDEFGDIKAFIRDYDDHDIYFCPHGFNRRSRSKQEAVIPNLLWADLDYSNPNDKKVFAGLKPTVAIESSPGRYVGLWVLKEAMTESLNRRLSYHLEADHGGWDLTQVLRFPGTKNYKYKTQPRVRTMWDDGPEYTRKRVEKHLPTEEEGNTGEYLSAADVFEEYEGKLPRWVRRELLAKKITGRADRSEMLWKLENACLEAGMSIDESFAVIRHSAWNKFKGRRNEDEQLRRELQKVVDHQFDEKPKGKDKRHTKSDREAREEEDGPKDRFLFIPIKDIKKEKIKWIWYPYLARKEVAILEGDPGLGKSYMAMMVAGAIASGQKLPSPKKGAPREQGSVVYFDIENNAGSVTKVRLSYNGYDDLGNYYPVEQAFSIDDEDAIAEIYEHLEEIKPILVVFDTLNTYIGRADTHKASESTQAMNVFKEIARDFDCAVLVLRHLTKGSGPAMYRGQGSIAFAGSVRMIMQVGVHPDDSDTRVMAQIKNNIAPKANGLSFEILPRPKGESEFVWGEYSDLTAEMVMDAAHKARTEGNKGNHVQDAMEFLEDKIKGVRVEYSRLVRMSEKRGITDKMLKRAASKMNIEMKTRKGVEFWELIAEDIDEDDD